jgi:hypothetical protein
LKKRLTDVIQLSDQLGDVATAYKKDNKPLPNGLADDLKTLQKKLAVLLDELEHLVPSKAAGGRSWSQARMNWCKLAWHRNKVADLLQRVNSELAGMVSAFQVGRHFHRNALLMLVASSNGLSRLVLKPLINTKSSEYKWIAATGRRQAS